MPEKDKETKAGQVSRRQFLKGAGIVIGGTAVGTSVLLSACGGGETTTVTRTNTTTATQTVTTTVGGGGTATQTVTTTAAGATKYVCPYDNQEFSTLAALKAHLDADHVDGGGAAVEGLVTLKVNGTDYVVKVEPDWVLSYVLREKCLLPGTKVGCARGECGTCTVLVDGVPMYACLMLAIECEGMQITTVEGLAQDGVLTPLQQSFIRNRGFQCGFCTPGFLLVGTALLAKNSNPTMDEVKQAVSGNLCACGNMNFNIKSIMEGGS